ncbi:MAG: hypothetical protein NTY30_01165 [Candidatus Berkelbacteria bacterium]|nr:hypothetical protein [Candidatus Berkelbacteria bacterium]
MGVEQGGPSEEDLRVRIEAGEPEGRTDDVDLAHDRALKSDPYRTDAKHLRAQEQAFVDAKVTDDAEGQIFRESTARFNQGEMRKARVVGDKALRAETAADMIENGALDEKPAEKE